MKILFILPPKFSEFRKDVGAVMTSPNIGVAYMAAYMTRRGFDVKIVDSQTESVDIKGIEKIIAEFKPQIIGLSAMTDRIHDAAIVADAAKRIDPGVFVVVGGSHATALPGETLIEFPSLDFCAIGEGEVILSELADALSGGGGFADIKGLAWRDGDRVVANPPAPRIKNLDALPFPQFDLFKLERYLAFYTRDRSIRELPVSTARGCPFKCAFCAKVMGDTVVYRSVDNVIEEIRFGHEKHGATQFVMTDESFTIKLKRTEEFCDKFISEGYHKKINWIVHSRVEVTKEILLKMRAANCTHITFGLESGNQEILDKNAKKVTLEKNLNAVRWAKEAGLITDGNMILGLPYETASTIRQTLRFALKCDPHYVSFFLFVPYPGTESMKLAQAGEANLRLLSTDWRDYGKQVGGAVELVGVSRKRLEHLQFIGYLLFYMRPSRIRMVFRKIDARTVLSYIKNLLTPSSKAAGAKAGRK